MRKLLYFIVLISGLSLAQNNNDAIRIAVLDFGTSGGLSEMEAVTLTNRLRSMLVKTNAFVVLERGKMDEILTEQGFQQTGCTTTECAVEVGKLLNVQKMVSGTIGKLGRTWTMDISLIDVETSQIEKSFFQDYKGEIDGLLDEMESVAIQIASISSVKKTEPKTPAKKIYTLSVVSTPQDAKIYLNDQYAGTTPFENKVRQGVKLTIKLQKENYQAWIQDIIVDDNVNITAKLEFTQEYKNELAARAKQKRDEPQIKEKSSGSTWWWIGGGVIVAGSAAAFLLAGDKKDKEPESEPTVSFPMPPGRP